MAFLRSLPAALALVLLAAHFLRWGSLMFLVPLALLALLLIRRVWVRRALQGALWLGCLEWLRTLVVLALERRTAGEPYLRMLIILGIVALFTVGAGFILPRAQTSTAAD